MGRSATAVEAGAGRMLRVADGWMNRVYGARWNPLYASGAIAVLLLGVLLVTGLYLLVFYRIGSPYASVSGIAGQVWAGRWIRALHRYAGDAAVVAVAVHAFRMFAQGRSWGPRALAWLSGLGLLGLVLVCGWTGYVMVWDVQAQLLAVEGARLLDLLPLFSEPIGRSFVGDRPLPAAFFFLNLFLHIALPVGLGLVLWLHVSRVSRPVLLPPRSLAWGVGVVLTALAVAWPVAMAPEASLLRLPGDVPVDVFYLFWLPAVRSAPAWAVWAGGAVLVAGLLAVPWLTGGRSGEGRVPSWVNERLCTGCEQCYQDCPYEAITMVPRDGGGRSALVARVDPSLCVSCGICAGSCAPMGVGPPGRTGRDQRVAARSFLDASLPEADDVVVIACRHSAAGSAPALRGAPVLAVPCIGNLHTSVVEQTLRGGAAGVLVVSCPGRDCRGREGPKWAAARLYEDREAELPSRVDRGRVHFVHAGPGEGRRLEHAFLLFRQRLWRQGSIGSNVHWGAAVSTREAPALKPTLARASTAASRPPATGASRVNGQRPESGAG